MNEIFLLCATVAEQIFFHIEVTSISPVIVVHIKLIEQNGFSLIINIPAGTGVIRDHHGTPHEKLVQRHGIKGIQLNLRVFGMESADKFL